MRVLLIDDDNALAALLTPQLTAQNYIVDRVADGETGWAYASTFEYDLIVLDWMLPQLDGINLCQRLRQQGYEMPILILTAKKEQIDKIEGFEAGADDYMVKPFNTEELLARVRVLLKRSHHGADPTLRWGELQLDPVSCQVCYEGVLITLTAKEYALLELFLCHPHQVFNAAALLDRLWSSDEFPSEATVRSHLRRLRRKLKDAGAAADFIETVHGLGYRLKSLATTATAIATTTDSAQAHQREAMYLKGLTQAWQAHKGESIERWNTLFQISKLLKAQGLSEQQKIQAQQIAHSLAGTLGTFGLMEGYRLAIEVEQFLLAANTPFEAAFSSTQAAQFQALVTTLGHALDADPKLVCPVENEPPAPKILLLDVNGMPFIQQLRALSVAQGLDATHAGSIEAASEDLCLNQPLHPASELTSASTDMVLVNLVASETSTALDEPILHKLLHMVTRLRECRPQVPIVVITPQADFGNRLELVRRGGAIVLEYPVAPTAVLETIQHTLQLSSRCSKIMIVDDDAHHLKQVVQRLHPWGFQITPLTNPQRFWTLFNQVLPDLVILDVEMPQINGFELCRVLRSHVQWQHLPIMFLSVHSDRAKQEHAFALGADDYITKPIQGRALANRLLNRLRRTEAARRWQRAVT